MTLGEAERFAERAARASAEAEVRAAAGAGDRSAATTLALRLYGGELYGFIAAGTGDEAAAEDAYAELCEVLWSQVTAFRWEASLRSWLYAVARLLARRQRVDSARRQRRVRALELSPQAAAVAAEVRTSTQQILRTSVKDELRKLRDELPEDERELLLLRVDRRMSWRDIARVVRGDLVEGPELDRVAAALRKRFERAKDRLRDAAAERGLLARDP